MQNSTVDENPVLGSTGRARRSIDSGPCRLCIRALRTHMDALRRHAVSLCRRRCAQCCRSFREGNNCDKDYHAGAYGALAHHSQYLDTVMYSSIVCDAGNEDSHLRVYQPRPPVIVPCQCLRHELLPLKPCIIVNPVVRLLTLPTEDVCTGEDDIVVVVGHGGAGGVMI